MVDMNPSYPNPTFDMGSVGQPQQPVFGANGMQEPIISGTGDVLPAPEKKSRKGIIIAIILAMLAVIGIFAVMFLMPRNGGVNGDAKLAFNRYVNYLLYGEDSDKALEGEYDENEIYYISEIRTEDTDYTEEIYKTIEPDDEANEDNSGNDLGVEAEEFFSHIEELWNVFYNVLDKNEKKLISAADKYRENLELYKNIILSGDSIESSWIQNRLSRMGVSQAKQWINSRYSEFLESTYQAVKNYGEKAIKYYTLYIDNNAVLNEAGCGNSDAGGVVCENSTYTGMANELMEMRSELITIKNNSFIDVVSGCWILQNDLNEVNKND